MRRLENQRALVSGAGSGIGRATVLRMLSEGASVAAVGRSGEGLDLTAELAAAAGHAENIITAVLDVSDEAAVETVVPEALSTLGGLDVIVNAAGILRGSHTKSTTLQLWNEVIGTNLTGTFLMTRAALPALLDGGGVVINIGSTSASFAHPYMAAYAASKGGILAFTRTLAMEYHKQGLRAVCLSPGGIKSGITTTRLDIPEDIDYSLLGQLTPVLNGGLGDPEMVAGVVAMLASEDGAFVTGTDFRIDGGAHM